jgi:hypothetical protein
MARCSAGTEWRLHVVTLVRCDVLQTTLSEVVKAIEKGIRQELYNISDRDLLTNPSLN